MSRASYTSERRQEQAAATRQAILDAARALFVERGYVGTTVADIAAAAHVAVPTVYVSVGPKPTILRELRKQIPILAGVPQDSEAELSLLGHFSNPLDLISGVVGLIRQLMETSGDLVSAIEAAAPFEPVAAQAWQEGLDIHRAGWGRAVVGLERLGALKQVNDITKTADALSLLSLPVTWRTLSQEYAWTYDEIETWIIQTSVRMVTDPSSAVGANKRSRSRSNRQEHARGKSAT